MIEIFKTKKKEFAFRVRAKNGKILVTSETYKRKGSVFKGIKAIHKLLSHPALPIIKDLTVKK